MTWVEAELAARGGAVPFRDFMELALYHPSRGYYSSGAVRQGRRGDYLTAPTASSWYPAVLARWLRRLAARVGPLTVVDLGSGDGSFLAGLLERFGPAESDWLDRVISVERSAHLRAHQGQRFARCSVPVEVQSDLSAAEHGRGAIVVHTSELYDALPVHRVVARDDGLRELWVARAAGGLEWSERPAPPALGEYLEAHGVTLVTGQMAELNLAAGGLHAGVLRWTGGRGVAIILDYGYPAARLYDPRGRGGGSLACYRGHKLCRDPLLLPGEQDITAHVNWDDLGRAAVEVGWQEAGRWGLGELLLRAGLAEEMAERGVGEEAELTAKTYAERQEVKRLLDPEGMGSDLKALVQASPAVLPVAVELLRSS